MVLPAVIAGAAVLGSAYMSAEEQKRATRAGIEAQEEALRQRGVSANTLEELGRQYGLPPELGTQILNPNDFQYQALDAYRPETESLVDLGPSAMEGISLDPATRAAQMQALSELSQMTEGDGMSAIDAANVANINRSIAQAQRGGREAIADNMRQRGVQGSGLELAAQLQSQQAGADRASMMGMDEAAAAMQRRMAALESMGQLGGSIRGQDFGEQSDVAQAQDAVSRFNAANRQDVYGRNTDRRNDATQADWRNRQGVANNNVSTRLNVAGMNNDTLAGQARFRNQTNEQLYGRAEGREGLKSGIAMDRGNMRSDAATQQGQANANMYSGIGQGIMQGANSYMQYDAAEKDRDAKYGTRG